MTSGSAGPPNFSLFWSLPLQGQASNTQGQASNKGLEVGSKSKTEVSSPDDFTFCLPKHRGEIENLDDLPSAAKRHTPRGPAPSWQ